MGLAALVATFTGIIGIGLIYATFDESRKANVISQKVAEDAAKEARDAKDAHVLAERAIIEVNQACFGEVQKDARFWPVVLQVRNVGRSNAHKVRIDWTVSREARVFQHTGMDFRNLDELCRHDGDTNLEFRIRPPKAVPAYLIGMLTYHTVRDARFTTYFCRQITGFPYIENSFGEREHRILPAAICEGLPRNT